MLCDICGKDIDFVREAVPFGSSLIVKATRRGYMPKRLPSNWHQKCKQFGVSSESLWKQVVNQNSSPSETWYLCEGCVRDVQAAAADDKRSTSEPRSRGPKLLWQCPDCGGILEKSQDTAALLKRGATFLGDTICKFCLSKSPISAVYAGQFDFADSDEEIRQKAADTEFMKFDDVSKRWIYRGTPVALASDKRWWQFWRREEEFTSKRATPADHQSRKCAKEGCRFNAYGDSAFCIKHSKSPNPQKQ